MTTATDEGAIVTVCDEGTVRDAQLPDTDDLIVAPPLRVGHALNTTFPSIDADDKNVVGPPSVTLLVLPLTNAPLSVASCEPDVTIVPNIESAGPIVAPDDDSATASVTPPGIVRVEHDVPVAHPAFSVIVAVDIVGHAYSVNSP